MSKKIFISLIVIILLIIGGFAVILYLEGFPVGFHNGRLVIMKYFGCSDYCSQNNGSWHKIYFGINNEQDCKMINGDSLINFAWGKGFLGCVLK